MLCKIHVHTNPGAACGACSGGGAWGSTLTWLGAAACHLPAPARCRGSSWGPPTPSLLLLRERLPKWWFLWRPPPHPAPSAVSSFWPPARSSRYIKAWAYPVVAQGAKLGERDYLVQGRLTPPLPHPASHFCRGGPLDPPVVLLQLLELQIDQGPPLSQSLQGRKKLSHRFIRKGVASNPRRRGGLNIWKYLQKLGGACSP